MIGVFAFLGHALDRVRPVFPTTPEFAEFARSYRVSSAAIGLSVLLCLFSTAILLGSWWRSNNPPSPVFAVLGTKEKINSSDSPRMSTQRVQNWLSASLIDMYSFNFTDADKVLEQNRWLFRSDTYDRFRNAFNQPEIGLADIVKNKSLDVSLVPTSTVRVIRIGAYEGRRVWEMEMLGLLSFSGATKEKNPSKKIHFTVIVEEVPTSESPYGLVISKITARN